VNLTIRHKTGTKYGVGFVSVEAGVGIEPAYTDLQCLCTKNPPENQ